MNKLGKIGIGIAVGVFVANEVWKAMSAKTTEKAYESLAFVENMKNRELIKKVYDKEEGLVYEDLTEREWQELRETFDKTLKECKKAYRLISITKIKRDTESIQLAAETKANIRNTIDVIKAKIEEMDKFLEKNRK